MRHNVAMKIVGDCATQCYDEVGRGSSLNRGEQMMKCVGTGGLCSLLRHRERGSILRLNCNISWAAETSPEDAAHEKDRWPNTFPLLVLGLFRAPFHVSQVTATWYLYMPPDATLRTEHKDE